MPNLNIEINFDSETLEFIESRDDKKVKLKMNEIVDFIMGKYGDIYLSLLVPHEDIFMELHAKKSDMKKRGAAFDMMPTAENTLKVFVKGTFKVSAYSHVAERLQTLNPPIYVTGIYAGDFPPVGSAFREFNKSNNTSKIFGTLVK